MVRYTKERLYELLPEIYRQRDFEAGKPLEALISIIAEQVQVLEDDIERLYDNWFIETCEEWVVPYIADLLGVTGLSAASESFLRQRALVANSVSQRREKGSPGMLEKLVRDITHWDARAVEFFRLLATTQNINHLRPSNIAVPDLRRSEVLELIGTPFDRVGHTVDVRHITNQSGLYNIPNIGISLWRLHSYPAIDVPAFNHGNGKFSFSQIGIDMPLFNHPRKHIEEPHVTEEINVACAIRRRALYEDLGGYYSPDGGKSIKIQANGHTKGIHEITVCDLTDWKQRPPGGKVAIDPVLGRIFFAADFDENQLNDVRVDYYYGFSGEVGGGFYTRPKSTSDSESGRIDNKVKTYLISKRSQTPNIYPSISIAIDKWKADPPQTDVIFEIADSEVYDESLDLILPAQVNLYLRSSQQQRPLLRGHIRVNATQGGHITLEGLLIDRKEGGGESDQPLIGIDKQGNLDRLTISYCTILPIINRSLELHGGNNALLVSIDHSILGRIKIAKASEAKLKVINSIVDGKVLEKIDDGRVKYNNINDNTLDCHEITGIENSTIFGMVEATSMVLATNSIFTGLVKIERRQVGCVRFCYIVEGSQIPRLRYHCQPEFASDKSKMKKDKGTTTNVFPRFTSQFYGQPGYAQLHKNVVPEIFEGADNRAEMGVFNHLHQPQRIKILKSFVDDYLRSGLVPGIFLVT